MTCPDCKQEFWNFGHRCPTEVKKCLGHMSTEELAVYNANTLILTDEDRQLMRDMLIGVD